MRTAYTVLGAVKPMEPLKEHNKPTEVDERPSEISDLCVAEGARPRERLVLTRRSSDAN